MQNEGALRQMTTKSTAVAAKRKERGDHVGRAPYGYRHAMVDGVSTLVPREGEDPGHVVDVFLREGAYLTAARALNAEGFPTRFPGRAWDPTTVRNVVRRARPELIAVRPRRGARSRSTRMFAGLLVCRCGRTMTSQPSKWGNRYYCNYGNHGTHEAPYSVLEGRVLDWAKAEVARFGQSWRAQRAPADGLHRSAETSLVDLEARRQRITEAFIDGDIDRDEKRRRLAEVEAAEAALEPAMRIVGATLRGKVDWSADPAEVNAELRNLWERVEMGPDQLPLRAVYNAGMEPKRSAAEPDAEAEARAARAVARLEAAGEL
jgi:hypothetical protein